MIHPRLVISLCGALVWTAACSSTVRPPKRTRLTTKELVKKSKPAIVRVLVKSRAGGGFGTGFVVSPDGRIATNMHVILGAEEAAVTLLDGSQLPVKRIVAYDADRDLVILDVDPGRPLPTLRLGNSDEVSAGDRVVAIGNPLGVLDYTVSDGLISSVRTVGASTVLQISAPISEGSSGGPLFNMYGEVIGVVRAFISQGQNLNFGIPSNYLQQLLKDNGEGWTVAAFAEKFAPKRPTIKRDIPDHELSVLDGCGDDSLLVAVKGITEAIRLGAPLYNQGNHEACFRIYEGTAARLERELACKGLSKALDHGLKLAGTTEGFTRKAWVMRDTFDGILRVIERKASASSP